MMDEKSYNIRVPKRWIRIAMIVGATALIVAPLTAVATHTFNDVPDSHTFHGDIEWLEASGVTKGCNPPANTNFCPDDNVTRGQMGAFMRRLAQYIGAEDGTPAQADNAATADSADKLDDKEPSFYERPIVMKTGSYFDGTNAAIQNGEIARVSIAAPASGKVKIEHTSGWIESGDFNIVLWAEPYNPGAVCDSRLDGDGIAGTWVVAAGDGATAADVSSAAGAGFINTSSGDTDSYSLCLDTYEGTSFNVDWSIQAAWYPNSAFETASISSQDTATPPVDGALTP